MYRCDLKGEWSLTKLGAKKGALNAKVPGDVHSALLAAGKIADPYCGMNELDLQWVGQENWSYSREFEVTDDLLAAEHVFLNCDCIDTFSKIFINGKFVGESDNMFLRVRFEARKLLRKGRNRIDIVIKSAEKEAATRAKKAPYSPFYVSFKGRALNRNFIRKVQCHSGWDWGICLMAAGIYGDIYLQAEGIGRVEHTYTTQRHSKGLCEVEAFAEIIALEGGEDVFEVSIGDITASKKIKLIPGLNKVSIKLKIYKPKLWWPNGLGEQTLYDMKVNTCGVTITKKLGLRKLEVISEKDKIGRSLIVRVNGEDIFCKGANWIPCDALPQRQTPEAIRDLLESAVKANMNCLRVWGGGQYHGN